MKKLLILLTLFFGVFFSLTACDSAEIPNDEIIKEDVLNPTDNDDIENEIDIINKYIVSRALCCPFNIDNTLNGKIISDIISSQYIYKITASVYEDVFKIIKITFPTLDENIDFLNKQREENKQGKIKILNDKTVEVSLALSQATKASALKANSVVSVGIISIVTISPVAKSKPFEAAAAIVITFALNDFPLSGIIVSVPAEISVTVTVT